MDVNADEGDWSAFESAPTVAVSRFNSANDFGFGSSRPSSPRIEDEWGTMDMLASPSAAVTSTLWGSPRPPARSLTPQPHAQPQARKSSMPGKLTAVSPASSSRPTPVSSPPPLPAADLDSIPKSTAGMTKEEKANEIARRKEERRLRIEKLKEQKRNVAPSIK